MCVSEERNNEGPELGEKCSREKGNYASRNEKMEKKIIEMRANRLRATVECQISDDFMSSQ